MATNASVTSYLHFILLASLAILMVVDASVTIYCISLASLAMSWPPMLLLQPHFFWLASCMAEGLLHALGSLESRSTGMHHKEPINSVAPLEDALGACCLTGAGVQLSYNRSTVEL